MSWLYTAYFISIVITILLAGYVAWFSRRQHHVPGSVTYSRLSIIVSLLAVFECLTLLSNSEMQALFWFNIRFLCLSVIPVLGLFFALQLSGNDHYITGELKAVFFIIPVITQIMIWTNSRHGLWVKHPVVFNKHGPFLFADTSARVNGLWAVLFYLYTYVLILIAVVFLVIMTIRLYKQYRGQVISLIAGSMVMIIGSLFSTFNIFPAISINFLPQGFALGSVVIAWGIYRHRFMIEKPLINGRKRAPAALIALYIIMTAGTTTGGYLYYRHYERNFKEEVKKELVTIASLKVDEVVHWYSERMADANVLYQNDAFTTRVDRLLSNPKDATSRWRLEKWLGNIQKAYKYNQIRLLDKYSRHVLSVPPSHGPECSIVLETIPDVRKSVSVRFLDFHWGHIHENVFLGILIPVVYDKNKTDIIAYVVFEINPEVYLYPMIRNWPGPSTTAETLLVRKDGENVLFLNELRFKKNTALNLRMPLSMKDLPAAMAARGMEGGVEGFDYRGKPVIAGVRAVPDIPWFMVARMDTAEAFLLMREKLWTLVAIIILFLAGSGAGFGLLWFRQNEQYFREKADAAEALKQSEERYRNTLENMIEGCQIIGLDWRYLYVNEAAARHGRKTREGLLGHTMMELYPGIEKSDMFGLIKDSMKTHKSHHLENEFVYSDNSRGWFDLSIQAVPEGVFILSIDITDRKKAEKALREEGERFARIAETAPGAICSFLVSRDGRASFPYASPAIRDIYGLYPEDLKDDASIIRPFINPEDLEPLREAISESVRILSPLYTEYRYRHPRKGEIWIAFNFSPSRQPDGGTLWHGFITDITERRMTDEMHRARSRLFMLAEKSTLDELLEETLNEVEQLTGSFISFYHTVGPDQSMLTLQSWSTRTKKEFCRAEGSGMHYPIAQAGVWVDCVYERKPLIHNDYASLTHKKGMPPGHALVIRELVVPVMRGNNITAILGVGNKAADYNESDIKIVSMFADLAWDITERKITEKKLRQSETKFRTLYESMAQGVIYQDRDGNITSANPAAMEILGLTDDEIMGRTSDNRYWRAVHEDGTDFPGDQHPSMSALHTGKEIQNVVMGVFNPRIQDYRWILINAMPQFVNGDTSPYQVYTTFIDITDLKKAEGELKKYQEHLEELVKQRTDELEKARAEAVAANRAKGNFLSSMSHEIRTPMNAILGFTQIMLRDELLSIRQRERLETITRSGEHLLGIINNILDFSKIEAGHVTVNHTTFDLFAMAKSIESMFHERAKGKGLDFVLEMSPRLPRFIETDEGKLRQIIINLLGNAVKFTEQGKISLKIRISRRQKGTTKLILDIEDTGPGITEDEKHLLFQDFVQTELGKSIGGTGLGLKLSRQFARLLGGNISVKSEKGKGSCFSVTVLIHEKSLEVHEDERAIQRVKQLKEGQGSIRVLVADDHEDTRRLMREILEGAGFQVNEAINGKEAVDKYQAWHPRVILMDMRMPVMDGYGAIMRIKSMNNSEKTKIIAVTASAFSEDRDKVMDWGADGYLRKPFKEYELFQSLQEQLGIEYVYEKDSEKSREKIKTPELPDQPVELPPDLAEMIIEAILDLDQDRLLELLERVFGINQSAAEHLKILAKNYQYDTLIDLVQDSISKKENG